MRLKKLIKTFLFEEINRGRIVLGDKVRLDPGRNRVTLELQADATTRPTRICTPGPGSRIRPALGSGSASRQTR